MAQKRILHFGMPGLGQFTTKEDGGSRTLDLGTFTNPSTEEARTWLEDATATPGDGADASDKIDFSVVYGDGQRQALIAALDMLGAGSIAVPETSAQAALSESSDEMLVIVATGDLLEMGIFCVY